MVGILTVRNLGDGVIETLKAQARANHRSLEAEVRHILTHRVDRAARVAQFRARTLDIARATPDVPQTDSVDLLRDDRGR